MKRYIIFLVLFFSFTHLLKAQDPDPLYVVDAYRKGFIVKNKDSIYYQRMFFKVFPTNFKTFEKYYGWDEQHQVGRPLTSAPPNYFTRIFYAKAYSRTEVIKKIVGISVNAKRLGPAMGQFQENSFKFAMTHTAQFISILKTYSKAEIISVWAFYMDYPNDNYRKSDYKKICNLVAPYDEEMIALITEGYKKDVAKWAHKP
ncbi:MAG TPA: hypothetical protein VNW51_09930 [Mucilaginibacter sp.]|jgi:hypothetical protein|nr:hypothetical protein [Mucilaginibacter sp.]